MGDKGGTTTVNTSASEAAEAEAALKQAELANKAQDWYENEMFPWFKEATEEANANARADSAEAANNYSYWRDYYQKYSDFYNGVSDDLYNQYKENYVPVEDSIIDQAKNFDYDAYADKKAAGYIGDLANDYRQKRSSLETSMQQQGYDPTSGHYQAAMAQLNDQQAYAQAAAAYTAQEEARNLGWTKQYYAAQQGQKYIDNALSTAQNAASTAGTAGTAMNNALSNASSYSQAKLSGIASMAQLGVNNLSSLSNAWSNYGNLASGLGTTAANASANNSQANANSYASNAGALSGLAAAGSAAGIKYANGG